METRILSTYHPLTYEISSNSDQFPMDHYMRSITKIALIGSATFMVAAVAIADGVESKVLREEDKAFNPMFGPVEFADAFGSREEGPHGTFGKFPAGFETPPHIHTHGYRAVVLKGSMTNPFEGEENPPVMEPGSYWAVEAGATHTTACVSDTPCEFLMWGAKNFDFIAEE